MTIIVLVVLETNVKNVFTPFSRMHPINADYLLSKFKIVLNMIPIKIAIFVKWVTI